MYDRGESFQPAAGRTAVCRAGNQPAHAAAVADQTADAAGTKGGCGMKAQQLIRELETGLQHANELLLAADCEPQFRLYQAFGSLRYTVQRMVRELRMDETVDDDENVNLGSFMPARLSDSEYLTANGGGA